MKYRKGFTLMELLVVIGILGLLAAIAIPKVIDTYERSRSATQAYSTADISRQLELFFALNRKYPDGFDSLMSTDGSAVYSKLATELETPHTLLTTATLTADQITSLNTAGIGHVFLHDATSSASDSGTDRRHFGTGTGHDGTANINKVVVVDKTTGNEGLPLLVNDFGLNPNKSASDTTLTRITANIYVVFGIGPKSTLVQSQIQEAPLMEHSTSTSNYSRPLAVFEVPVTGTTKAKLVGVIGPDGRSKKGALNDFNSTTGVQAH